MAQQAGAPWQVAAAEWQLGNLARWRGDAAGAAGRYGASLALARDHGSEDWEAPQPPGPGLGRRATAPGAPGDPGGSEAAALLAEAQERAAAQGRPSLKRPPWPAWAASARGRQTRPARPPACAAPWPCTAGSASAWPWWRTWRRWPGCWPRHSRRPPPAGSARPRPRGRPSAPRPARRAPRPAGHSPASRRLPRPWRLRGGPGRRLRRPIRGDRGTGAHRATHRLLIVT